MPKLFIIGNGFDIFSGLRTRYVDFRHWLQYTYPFIYENMYSAYEMDGEWWHDFEFQLGKLDVKRYVSKFAPPNKSIDEIKKACEGKEFKKNDETENRECPFCSSNMVKDIKKGCGC